MTQDGVTGFTGGISFTPPPTAVQTPHSQALSVSFTASIRWWGPRSDLQITEFHPGPAAGSIRGCRWPRIPSRHITATPGRNRRDAVSLATQTHGQNSLDFRAVDRYVRLRLNVITSQQVFKCLGFMSHVSIQKPLESLRNAIITLHSQMSLIMQIPHNNGRGAVLFHSQ